jgi:eukaryotic-like serine/threonine-protein kinase
MGSDPCTVPRVSSLVGRTLERYEVVEEISRSGMGIVYRARDVRLNRDVALKVLPATSSPTPAATRGPCRKRTRRPPSNIHIAVIHEIDEADGVSFIAMELVRGEVERLHRSRPARAWARAPTSPLKSLRRAGARARQRHRARDLKPANVMPCCSAPVTCDRA